MKNIIIGLFTIILILIPVSAVIASGSTPPPPPSAPNQSPIGFIWLAIAGSFAYGWYAMKKRH